MIYLIKQVGKPICKIGYATDPKKRIKQLQTGSSVKLQLLKVLEGDIVYERAIHAKFAKFRLTGEWFSYEKSIKDYFTKWSKATKRTEEDEKIKKSRLEARSIPARKVKSEIRKK